MEVLKKQNVWLNEAKISKDRLRVQGVMIFFFFRGGGLSIFMLTVLQHFFDYQAYKWERYVIQEATLTMEWLLAPDIVTAAFLQLIIPGLSDTLVSLQM